MALKNGIINPLNVLGYRVVQKIPNHFVRVKVESYQPKELHKWIYQNLNSRYGIVDELEVNGNNLVVQKFVCFEDPKEASMFVLMCPNMTNQK